MTNDLSFCLLYVSLSFVLLLFCFGFFLAQDGSLINFANWADWYVNHPSEDRTFVAWYKGSGTEQNHALPIE